MSTNMRYELRTILTAALICLGALLASAPFAIAASGPGLRVTWNQPREVAAGDIEGYNIYRSDNPNSGYARLNDTPVPSPVYDDTGLETGNTYYYRVTTVFSDGTESKPTDPVGMTAGAAAGTNDYRPPKADFFTSNALGKVLYLNDEAVFVLKSSPGLGAVMSIKGVADDITMTEVQPGTYKCVYRVASGVNISNTYAEAVLTDKAGGKAVARTAATISMTGLAGPSLAGVYVGVLEADRVGLNWPKYDWLDGSFSVYRSESPITHPGELYPIADGLSMDTNAYMDVSVSPDTKYYYVIASVDKDGWITDYSDNVEVTVPHAGRVSGIEYVREDSGGRTLVPGDTLNVTMETAPGGTAWLSLGEAAREVRMSETGQGAYTGSYVVREGDGVFKSRVAAGYRDTEGKTHFLNSATFVSVNAPRTALASLGTGVKPVITEVTDNVSEVVGVSRRLTAGMTFTVNAKGDPGCTAFFNVGKSVWKIPMTESGSEPGLYSGTYTVRPGDNAGTSGDPMDETYVTAYLAGPGGSLSEPVTSLEPVIIDTSCKVLVEAEADTLPADGVSRTKVRVTVTDADGEPVKDRRLTLLLEPPNGYTGVVGGGGMAGVDASSSENPGSMLGSLEVDYDDMTDEFGHLEATYTSGYAAKTAMIVVRDYLTGSVGMDYVRTGIDSTVSITLEDPDLSNGPVTEPPVYDLVLDFQPEEPLEDEVSLPWFMVDAIPNTLTADGRSRATVVATLTADGVPVEGKQILFSVMGAGGSFTKYSDNTDAAGMAQTFFIAGTRAGRALITATEAETGVTVTRTVTLLADAPARIYASAHPDTIPADGISMSEISVEVADANGNPTPDVVIGFEMEDSGLGDVSSYSETTDERGFCSVNFSAGYAQGVAVVKVTAMSPEPDQEQLDQAADRLVAPVVYDNDPNTELRLVQWLKDTGDEVGAGEPVAVIETPLGRSVVHSPVSGMLEEQAISAGMIVMEGKEIGIVGRRLE